MPYINKHVKVFFPFTHTLRWNEYIEILLVLMTRRLFRRRQLKKVPINARISRNFFHDKTLANLIWGSFWRLCHSGIFAKLSWVTRSLEKWTNFSSKWKEKTLWKQLALMMMMLILFRQSTLRCRLQFALELILLYFTVAKQKKKCHSHNGWKKWK